MGMYCCCGVKKTSENGEWNWKCECDQTGWHEAHEDPPTKDGIYEVRILTSCADGYEDEIEFSVEPKFEFQIGWCEPCLVNWNCPQSDDSVYQWKEISNG